MNEEGFLTTEEAQAYLGVKRPTLYKYIRLGRLRVYKSGVGYRSYFKQSELDELKAIRPVEGRDTQKAA